MSKVRLVQMIDGQFLKEEFVDANAFLPVAEIRGYTLRGFNKNPRQRAELQGAPQFDKLCGPMWDGDAIRYEDQASNDRLSA